MRENTRDNLAVVAAIALIIAAVVALWYVIANNLLGEILWIAIVALLVILAVFTVIYVVLGIFYAVKQRDTVHTEYSSSLGDIQEVDREMNNDDKKQ